MQSNRAFDNDLPGLRLRRTQITYCTLTSVPVSGAVVSYIRQELRLGIRKPRLSGAGARPLTSEIGH